MTANKEAILPGPVSVCAQNPHYYSYKGSPILLITSAEHYGAVINLDFDYTAYLDRLRQYELNYTRIYPGGYYEDMELFGSDNTLAPERDKLILPWARSGEPGYKGGGNKFDLTKWDARFFQRLRDFISASDSRDIIVEVCFYNAQYPECWEVSPFFTPNNAQGIGNYDCNDFQTTLHKEWYDLQKAYVRKIVEEVNDFDNVILEMCDEPTTKGTPTDLAVEWLSGLADVVVETEKGLPKKHLLAQQLELGVDFTADDRVPVIVTQYILHNQYRQVGGIEGLDSEYGHNKPIEMNETGYYPLWYEEDKVAASRVEGWEFMIGGGAGFNHLNALFNVKNPSGDTEDNHVILKSLQNLKHFLYGFDFVKMYKDNDFVKGGVPAGAYVRCISEPGRQYAVYIHHSRLSKDHWWYVVTPGEYFACLEVGLPAGTYTAEWIMPETGACILKNAFRHEGDTCVLKSPGYKIDIALSIKANIE